MEIFLIISSMRPKQWIKNLLVFTGLVFARRFTEPKEIFRTIGGFLAFCLVSGAVYIINDIKDRDSDRCHPKKRLRPIASGKLKISSAVIASVVLLSLGFLGGWYIDGWFGLTLIVYFILQLAYSFGLKRVVVLDVMVVALGFTLRAFSGTFIVHVDISPWLFICITLLALFLAIAKRRHELLFLEEGTSHRSVLEKYSEMLLDQMIAIVTSATIVSYCLYTIAPETVHKFRTRNLIFTIPFVLYGIFRYLYLVYRKEEGDAPEKVFFTDLPLLIDIGLWIGCVLWVLLFAPH